MMFLLLFVISLASSGYGDMNERFQTAFEWNYVNFTWPSNEAYKSLNYHPDTYIPVGIKIHQPSNRIFISLPRVKEEARITLASIFLDGDKRNQLLTPYPSWEMNTGSNCDTLQDVMSMEIDKDGIMWVVDARRTSTSIKCPPKLVLFDLKDNDRIVKRYVIPDELCPHNNGCFLNDIVVDGDFAYFSDTTASDPGILIYNRKLNKSWKARNNRTMWGVPEASNFVAQGVNFRGVSHINGIALSPSCPTSEYFYFTPQTSFHIYSIPTIILKHELLAEGNISGSIKEVIVKSGATGGMIGDSTGNIYFGILPEDSVVVANSRNGSLRLVDKNSNTIKWPDTFAFDMNGNLYVTTTQILRFKNKDLNLDEVNFRILKLHTGTNSYFYCGSF